MDFFAMKRKKLQSLCKKHGIPANLKNKDMAEKLSLIYKEEKNENPGSHLLRSDADKSNVEIIILDSDSDSDVQMEALDTVAERDFNEKTNVSTEHLIDEEPNQILTTSPRSEVKSDLKIIPHTDDSGTASGSDDASTAVKHTDEVKSSDLNNLMSHSLRSDQDKSKLEITELGSDNDIDVQMEASDTVAEKYSNERTNVSAEYLLDEEPDQFITTSPLSEVKSGDLNNLVSHPLRSNEDKLNLDIKELDSDSDTDVQMEALDTFAEKDSNERTNVSAEHLLDEEPIQSTTSPLSEVKSSDFNNIVFCPLQTDEDKSNLEFKELNSDNDTVVQMEGSDIVAEKDSDEKTNMRAGNLLDKEPNQFLTTSPLSDVKSADLNVQHTVDSDAGEVKSASMQKTNQGREESSMKLTPARSGNVGSFYVEEDMPMSANILEGFGNNMMLGDQTLSESTDVHEDTDLYEGSVEQFNKFDDYHYVKSHSATTCLDASPGVKNTDDNTNVNVENILDEVHSSSFEDSDETPVQFLKTNPLNEVETSDLDAEKMVVTGTATKKRKYTSGAKFGLSQKMNMSPASKEIVGSSAKLLNNSVSPRDIVFCNVEESMEVGANKEQVDPRQEKTLEFSPKLFNNPGSPTNGDVGLCGLEENLEVGVNKENIDPSEDVMLAEPTSTVMGDNEDFIHAVSEELGNNLMEENLDIGVNKENIDPSEDVMHAEPSALVMGDNEDLIQAVSEELGNDLTVDEVASVDDKYDLLEDVPGSVNPGSKENADSNTYVTSGDILDEVHSSSFEDSDVTPVQFLTTDPLSEAETSDLDVNKMFETATTTRNADISGVKIESSPNTHFGANKEQVDPRQEKTLEFSPKLFNNPGSPTNGDVGLCGLEENLEVGGNKENIDPSEDVMLAEPTSMVMGDNEDFIHAVSEELGNNLMEENLDIGVNKENIDPSEDFMHAEPSALVMGDNEDLIQAVSEELGNDLTVDEVASVDDKYDLLEDVPGSANPGSKKNADSNTYVTGGDILDEVHSSSFEDSDVTPVQFLPTDPLREAETSDLDVNKMFETAKATKDADTRGAKFESSPKTSLYPTPKKMIGSSTKLLNNSGAPTNFGFCDMEENLQIGVNKENIDPNDEDLHAEPSLVVMRDNEEVDLSNYQMAALEACEEEMRKSSEKTSLVADPEECIGFSLNDLRASTTKGSEAETYFESTALGDVEETCNMEEIMQTNMMEEENNQENYIPAQQEVNKCFDDSGVHDDSGRVGVQDENQAYSASRKRKGSVVNDNSGANSDEEVKADELVPDVLQSSEMESCDFGLQLLFAQDTASGVEDANRKKSDSPSKATPIASGEKNITFTPKFNESSMSHKKMKIDIIEEEDNQEDDISVQRVVSKFFDNSDVHDDIGHVGAEDENQAYSTSLKRKRSDVDEISGANSDSEMESSDFGLQQLFAQDTASGDEGAIQKDSQSKATPVARGEKCIIFTPKFNESSMVHKEMEIAMFEEENNQEGCISAQQEVSKFFDTSDVHDDIGRDGAKDEDLAYSASRKRKMSDVNDTSGANSNEEVKVDELVPVVPQSSEMESCGLGLQQLFAQDNASEDGDAFQKKFDSSSKGTPIANVEKSIIFTPKLHESSMMHKKMRIEMNLSHKPAARDSLGTMKENIKTDKEEVSSTVSRNKFAKRLPLQDLHQN